MKTEAATKAAAISSRRREEIKRTREDIARVKELQPLMYPAAYVRSTKTLAYLNAKLLLMLSEHDPPERRRRRKR